MAFPTLWQTLNHSTLLLAGAVKQTAYEDVVTFRFNLGSLSTLCTLTATLDSQEEAAHSQIFYQELKDFQM